MRIAISKHRASMQEQAIGCRKGWTGEKGGRRCKE
jgi:hypothetical protein